MAGINPSVRFCRLNVNLISRYLLLFCESWMNRYSVMYNLYIKIRARTGAMGEKSDISINNNILQDRVTKIAGDKS
jgi:hypothetical protein